MGMRVAQVLLGIGTTTIATLGITSTALGATDKDVPIVSGTFALSSAHSVPVIPGTYEMCATTFEDGSVQGTDELPCADPLATKDGIKIRTTEGLTMRIRACKLLSEGASDKQCFTYRPVVSGEDSNANDVPDYSFLYTVHDLKANS